MKKKEIGGYLELENLMHNEYYPDLIALNTARNAFVYLCRAKQIKKVYLPCFLCDSVSGVCDREGICYEYYHINPDFTPRFEKTLGDNEWLYIVNYYGQISTKTVIEFKKKHGNIIFDNVQAFFERPLPNVDTIYSCRKFFGVPDGAYLSTDAQRLELDTDISKDRMRHILGRYEGISASEYYSDFKANDHSFVELPLRYMSKLTHNILGAIDYKYVAAKRNENWNILHEALGEKNKLHLVTPDAPYMYPFYCENGIEIKKRLAEAKIFIPTLWPNILSFEGGELEKDYAKNILPLPIDQRYDCYTMKYIINNIVREIKRNEY